MPLRKNVRYALKVVGPVAGHLSTRSIQWEVHANRLASDVAFRFPDIARTNSTAPRLVSQAVQRCVRGVSLAQARAAKTAASALAASALEGACTEAHRTPLGDSAAAVCS